MFGTSTGAAETVNGKSKKLEKSRSSGKAAPVSTSFSAKAYVKALPLRSLDDVPIVKNEVESGNILILRISRNVWSSRPPRSAFGGKSPRLQKRECLPQPDRLKDFGHNGLDFVFPSHDVGHV